MGTTDVDRHPPALADVPMALKISSDAGVAARWLGRWLRQQPAWKEGLSPEVACMCHLEDVTILALIPYGGFTVLLSHQECIAATY